MILTEEEAKTKWCPFGAGARMVGTADEGGKLMTVYARPDTAHCIGTGCMAWRSEETHDFSSSAEAEFYRTGRVRKCDTGFCGLAGRPS